jgi:prolipoprotein diacylglyceryl transferase
MYPKLSDLINDLFGTNINLPIQSYGFFLALAFLAGAFVLYLELGRKEKEGILPTTTKKVTKGKPASTTELIINFIISFILGFKFVEFFLHYSQYVDNPQDFLASSKGSWLGGLIFAALYTGYIYYTKERKKLPKPLTEKVVVHPKEHTLPILFIAVVAGILGAKVFHWFENWDEFTSDPLGSLLSFSGLTFYGGLIVAVISVLYYGERHQIGWKYLSDAASPSLILAYGIGRIGCQVSGDGDWGIVNTAPKPGWLSYLPDWVWAYDYPNNVINEGIPIPGCVGEHCFRLAETVYPTPIYETTMAVIIFFILWSIRKKIQAPGALFAIYLMFNGVERFLIEKIRVNNVFDFLGMQVTQAEIISTFMFLAGVGLLFLFYHQYRKSTT